MSKVWTNDELIEVDGAKVEKQFAFPNLNGNQSALMLHCVNGQWVISGWGGAYDGEGTITYGWEALNEGTLDEMLDIAKQIGNAIEESGGD
jgi:hypothetical protein